ncbi:MAG: GtrA family protein [Anaerolineales bacterium]
MKGIEHPIRSTTAPPPAWHRRKASVREAFLLLRYMASSLVTAATDYLIFLFSYPLLQNIPASIFLARAASVLINYLLLRMAVFGNREHILHTFPRYIMLVAVSGITASLMIPRWMEWLSISVIGAKMLTEGVLYFINYLILKNLVFLRKTASPKDRHCGSC